MNPVNLAILIIKVAICTLPFVFGLRLLFLSKETFVNFAGRLFGIADLELSPSTFVTVKVFGVILVLIGLGLAYLFFWPETRETARTAAQMLLQNPILACKEHGGGTGS